MVLGHSERKIKYGCVLFSLIDQLQEAIISSFIAWVNAIFDIQA